MPAAVWGVYGGVNMRFWYVNVRLFSAANARFGDVTLCIDADAKGPAVVFGSHHREGVEHIVVALELGQMSGLMRHEGRGNGRFGDAVGVPSESHLSPSLSPVPPLPIKESHEAGFTAPFRLVLQSSDNVNGM